MLHSSIQQHIDLWEAWIEFDSVDPKCFGTLFIIGEIETDKRIKHISKSCRLHDPKHLVLNINTSSFGTNKRSAEVVYSEPIKAIDQYSSINIYSGDDLIAVIEDIEVII